MWKALPPVLCAVLLGSAGCVSQGDAPTTTERIVNLTTTTLAGTTTTTTSPTPSTSTMVVVSSTTTLLEIPLMLLEGSSVRYSTTGSVLLQGFVDRPAQVTVDGLTADAAPGPGDGTSFWAEVLLDPGVKVVVVTATPRYTGARVTQLLTVVVDTSLEEQFAYIVSVDPAAGTVTADFAEYFGGEEAVQAAREDGAIGPNEDLPGPFYIRNTDPQTRVLTLAEVPVIVLQACYQHGPCVTMSPVDERTWADLIADPESSYDLVGWWWYGGGHLPCWLTLDDGVVVQIRENYLP